jgi:hypothetical protein
MIGGGRIPAMTQMRKALLLPFNLAIASAAFAADAGRNRPAGRARQAVPGLGTVTLSDMSGAREFRRGRNEVNPARQARETPI